MRPLHQSRCLNHAEREAVARCPQCGHFYCRECVVEHDDRLLCAGCLKKLFRRTEARGRPGLIWARRLAGLALSTMIAWSAFYLVGKLLVTIPDSVHQGSFWQQTLWNE